MADKIIAGKKQSLAEIRTWDVDFTPDLRGSAVVSSATATHTPPSGSAATPTVGSIVASVVPVTLGPLSVTGTHYLDVLATCDDAEKLAVRIQFEVLF